MLVLQDHMQSVGIANLAVQSLQLLQTLPQFPPFSLH